MQPSEALHEDSAEDLYDNAPCGYLSALPDGVIARVNQTFLTWSGYRRDELVGRRRFADLLSAGGRIYHETHLAPLLRMQGSVRSIALEIVRPDGTVMPVLVNATLRTDDAGLPLTVRTTVFDATDRQAYERELLLARRRAEQYAERLRALETVVADLAAVATLSQVSRVVAAAGVETFTAEASAVWLVDDDTAAMTLEATAGPHGDDALQAPLPLPTELEVGESPAGTTVVVPLSVTGRVLGALVLRTRAEAVTTDDRTALRTLGQQAGQAVQRARLYEAQRSVATTLQRSMLPSGVPEDPRVEIATTYRPAVDTLEVGGDWFDAFPLDPDRLAVVVGDVVGRGLQAAAVMGQLRSAIRALSVVDSGPAGLLSRLDAFAEGVPAAETATLAYVEIDLRDGSARYACAGHPPPVVLGAGGDATLLWEGRSSPLGTHFGTRERPEGSFLLPPGARLVLYTDGLVERRDRGLDEGIEALTRTLQSHTGCAPGELSEALADELRDDAGAKDDVCVLVLSYDAHLSFRRTVPADRSRVAGLRRDLAGWLTERGVLGVGRDAVVLACSEAVANAIEHGYGDDARQSVDVLAAISSGQLSLRVRDSGRWRAPGPPGHRGRGIRLIRELMDDLVVQRSGGTVVSMRRYVGEVTS